MDGLSAIGGAGARGTFMLELRIVGRVSFEVAAVVSSKRVLFGKLHGVYRDALAQLVNRFSTSFFEQFLHETIHNDDALPFHPYRFAPGDALPYPRARILRCARGIHSHRLGRQGDPTLQPFPCLGRAAGRRAAGEAGADV